MVEQDENVEVLTSITTGSAAALTISLLLRPLWNVAAHRSAMLPEQALWIGSSSRAEAMYLGAHALAGAAQGLLFWLSWGLAALTTMSWWLQGLAVGAAFATLLVLPIILICSSVIRVDRKVLWVLCGETVATCISVGLACSWHWMQR